jgi:3D (Asp-Asp-Asp) domain-containing protein
MAGQQGLKAVSSASIQQNQVITNVRTTAYTHTEGDHLQYGTQNAAGSGLKYGQLRSAAADWSVYPVGTVFQIQGDPALYVVDDYGSALVGTGTIDLYKPDQTTVDHWGVRKVNIRVVRWGCFSKSLAILMPRQMKAPHVRQMIWRLVMRAET